MGTTITVALVGDLGVTFGHVGDSRAYALRDGELEQLTDDHSLVAELVRAGKLWAEEAEHHPQRSVITRALGTDPDVDVDTFTVEARPGDVFLLCSDGLTDMIGDEEIVQILDRRNSLDDAARTLVGRANDAGGQDNITVVAFEITDEPDEPDERTLEQTLNQTRPLPVPETAGAPAPDVERQTEPAPPAPESRRAGRRFLPLLLLIAAIVVAAVVLWVLAR
jgi:protein phosphatase